MLQSCDTMRLRLIQGGLAQAASEPPTREHRLSGAFTLRPHRPPPPEELRSSLGPVTLAVTFATLLLFAALL